MAEGKSRIEAMRCLKRHLARRYHRLLLSVAVERDGAHDPVTPSSAAMRRLT